LKSAKLVVAAQGTWQPVFGLAAYGCVSLRIAYRGCSVNPTAPPLSPAPGLEPVSAGSFRRRCLLASSVLVTLEAIMGQLVQDDEWRLPDKLWTRLEPLLPDRPPHPLGCHNPRVPDRSAMNAIFFVLRTGCQ